MLHAVLHNARGLGCVCVCVCVCVWGGGGGGGGRWYTSLVRRVAGELKGGRSRPAR